MNIVRLVNRIYNSNTYIIHEEGKCVIIDIGDIEPVIDFVESHRLKLCSLLLTHTHYDHIYGVKGFMETFPNVRIYTSSFGKEALKKPNWNFSRYHNDQICVDSENICIVEDREVYKFGELFTVKVLATPGHDKSCLSYLIDDNLFTGDSFIPDVKVVATFPNSDRRKAQIWYDRLCRLGEDLNIYPGHGNIQIKRE